MLSMSPCGAEYPLGQLGSAVLAVSSPSFQHSQPLCSWEYWEAEKTFTVCKPCSERAKPSLYYQHCFQHKSKTHWLLWRKWTPPQPKPAWHDLHFQSWCQKCHNDIFFFKEKQASVYSYHKVIQLANFQAQLKEEGIKVTLNCDVILPP